MYILNAGKKKKHSHSVEKTWTPFSAPEHFLVKDKYAPQPPTSPRN